MTLPFEIQMFLAEFRVMHIIYQVYIIMSLIVFLNLIAGHYYKGN